MRHACDGRQTPVEEATLPQHAHQQCQLTVNGEPSPSTARTLAALLVELGYEGVKVVDENNRQELRAQVRVDGGEVFEPRVNRYLATGQTVPTPSVDQRITRDIYLSLQSTPDREDATIVLRVIVQPMVIWLWIGGMVMVFGTALAGSHSEEAIHVDSGTGEPGTQHLHVGREPLGSHRIRVG